jgi:hypothetical protein
LGIIVAASRNMHNFPPKSGIGILSWDNPL